MNIFIINKCKHDLYKELVMKLVLFVLKVFDFYIPEPYSTFLLYINVIIGL